MPRGVSLEWSHGRRRPVTRGKDVPALVHEQKARAGRLGAIARWHRSGASVAAVGTADDTPLAGIQTLNPGAVPAWMRGAALQGLAYRDQLQALLDGQDALYPLAGDTVDAHTVYKATLARGIKAKDPTRRAALMAEARAWL